MTARHLLRVHLIALGVVALSFLGLIAAHRIVIGRANVTRWEIWNFFRWLLDTGDLVWLLLAHLGLWVGLISTRSELSDKWKFRHLWLFFAGAILASSISSVIILYWRGSFVADRVFHISAVLEWGESPAAYGFSTLGFSILSVLLIVVLCPIAAALERRRTYSMMRAAIAYILAFSAGGVGVWIA